MSKSLVLDSHKSSSGVKVSQSPEVIAGLQSKLADLEQKSRNCNVEICNLPEKRGENLVAIVERIAKVINIPLSSHDINGVHRVALMDPKSSRPRNIILKLCSQIKRDNFVSAVRLIKGITTDKLEISGPPRSIYVNEHLTLANKKLFRQVREAALCGGYRYVWIKNGTILVRAKDTSPAFAIRSEKELCKIKPITSVVQ
ncbi:hypothetical protein ACJJTC_005176 [Scirpophaga incertulas]